MDHPPTSSIFRCRLLDEGRLADGRGRRPSNLREIARIDSRQLQEMREEADFERFASMDGYRQPHITVQSRIDVMTAVNPDQTPAMAFQKAPELLA